MALVPSFGSRCHQGSLNSRTLCLEDLRRLEVLIEQDKQNRVPRLRQVNGSHSLAALGVAWKASAFDLQASGSPAYRLSGVEPGLPGGRQFEAEQTRRLIFGDFSRYAERLAREGSIALCQSLRFGEQHTDLIISHLLAPLPTARPVSGQVLSGRRAKSPAGGNGSQDRRSRTPRTRLFVESPQETAHGGLGLRLGHHSLVDQHAGHVAYRAPPVDE